MKTVGTTVKLNDELPASAATFSGIEEMPAGVEFWCHSIVVGELSMSTLQNREQTISDETRHMVNLGSYGAGVSNGAMRRFAIQR